MATHILLSCALSFLAVSLPVQSVPIPVTVNLNAGKLRDAYATTEQEHLRREFSQGVLGVLSQSFGPWSFVLDDRPGSTLKVLVYHLEGTAGAIEIKMITSLKGCAPEWRSQAWRERREPWRTNDWINDHGYHDKKVDDTVGSMTGYFSSILVHNQSDITDCLIKNAPIAKSSHWSATHKVVLPLPHKEHFQKFEHFRRQVNSNSSLGLKVMCEGPCRYGPPWLVSLVLVDPEAYPPGDQQKLFDALAAEPRQRHCGDVDPPVRFNQLLPTEIEKLKPKEVFLLRFPKPRDTDILLSADVVP